MLKKGSKNSKAISEVAQMHMHGENCDCNEGSCECGSDECCESACTCGMHYCGKCGIMVAIAGIVLLVVGSGAIALPGYINGWTVAGLFLLLGGIGSQMMK